VRGSVVGAEGHVAFGVVRLHRADGSFHVHLPRFEGAEEVACGLEGRVRGQCALLGEVQLRVQLTQRRRQFRQQRLQRGVCGGGGAGVFGLAGVLGVAARLLQLRLQFLNAQAQVRHLARGVGVAESPLPNMRRHRVAQCHLRAPPLRFRCRTRRR
jgi:hypothetical protein